MNVAKMFFSQIPKCINIFCHVVGYGYHVAWLTGTDVDFGRVH